MTKNKCRIDESTLEKIQQAYDEGKAVHKYNDGGALCGQRGWHYLSTELISCTKCIRIVKQHGK